MNTGFPCRSRVAAYFANSARCVAFFAPTQPLLGSFCRINATAPPLSSTRLGSRVAGGLPLHLFVRVQYRRPHLPHTSSRGLARPPVLAYRLSGCPDWTIRNINHKNNHVMLDKLVKMKLLNCTHLQSTIC
jgi:hypothetical protein